MCEENKIWFLFHQMERKERKSPASDTLYEVVSLESETEREKRKTTASPGILSTGPGSTVPSPPEDDEEEGDCMLSIITWLFVFYERHKLNSWYSKGYHFFYRSFMKMVFTNHIEPQKVAFLA